MKIHGNCKGCTLVGELNYIQCAYADADIEHLCPCALCLTKVVCNKILCDERAMVYHEVMDLDYDNYLKYRETKTTKEEEKRL